MNRQCSTHAIGVRSTSLARAASAGFGAKAHVLERVSCYERFGLRLCTPSCGKSLAEQLGSAIRQAGARQPFFHDSWCVLRRRFGSWRGPCPPAPLGSLRALLPTVTPERPMHIAR